MIGNTSYTTRKQKPNNDNKSSLKPSSNYKDYPKETWNKDLYYIRMESIIKGTTQFQNNIKIDKEFNLRYTLSDFIGSGVYGNVYSGFDKLTHTQIAVKFVDVHDKSFKREIVCLTQLKNSQFIIKLLDVVELEEHVGLVTELADTDLATVMDSYEGGMPESIAKVWIYQILLGLAYCHTNNIWHRDIKPDNILVRNFPDNRNPVPLIGDFGMSLPMARKFRRNTVTVATPMYRAPEVFYERDDYNEKIDIWSVGVILGEMLKGAHVFQGSFEDEILPSIFRVIGYNSQFNTHINSKFVAHGYDNVDKSKLEMMFERILSPSCLDFLRCCWSIDTNKRISALDGLGHSFFDDIRLKMQADYKVEHQNLKNIPKTD